MKIKQALTMVGAAGMVLLLSGCLSLEAEITLDDQARGDGQLTVAINKQAASMAGIASKDAFEKALTEDPDADAPFAGSTMSYSETDTDYVASATFRDAVLDDDEWHASIREDGTLEFAFVNEGMGDEELLGDTDFGRVDLTINFPGDVIEFSGEGATKVDEDTVRWQFPASQENTLAATSQVGGGSSPVMLIVGAVAGLALLVLGAAVAVSRRKKGATVGGAETVGAGVSPEGEDVESSEFTGTAQAGAQTEAVALVPTVGPTAQSGHVEGQEPQSGATAQSDTARSEGDGNPRG